MKLNKLLILSIIGFISFSSCKKDDPVTPVIPNEQEVITTLNYTLTNAFDTTDVVTLTFVDLDGDGGTAPTITSTASKADKFIFTAIDSSSWLGSVAGQNYTV